MNESHHTPDADDDSTEEVPAGRSGADSGAADTVRIDSDDRATVPDRSHGNDTAGVGPREPDTDDIDEQLDAYRASRPDALSDETGGAPHLNARERPAPDEQ